MILISSLALPICAGEWIPITPEYFEKFSSEEEAIRAYFAETLENLKCHDDYDVLGHLDYIVRVAPSKDKNYSYDKYKDAIDPILELVIQIRICIQQKDAAGTFLSAWIIKIVMLGETHGFQSKRDPFIDHLRHGSL